MQSSIFTQIIERKIPSNIHYEDDDFIVIDDINPMAPVHVLVISKQPLENIEALPLEETALLGKLLKTTRTVAHQLNIADNYKVAMNVGPKVQAVLHLHLHVMGGWPNPDTHTKVGF